MDDIVLLGTLVLVPLMFLGWHVLLRPIPRAATSMLLQDVASAKPTNRRVLGGSKRLSNLLEFSGRCIEWLSGVLWTRQGYANGVRVANPLR